MALYRLETKIIARNQGRSAVAAAAYRAGDEIENQYDGITHNYKKKRHIEYSEIVLPEGVPQEFSDRSRLWNSVELSEKPNGRLAREVLLALPSELTVEQSISLIEQFIQDNFVSEGMCADYSIHNPPLVNDRKQPIDSDGNPTREPEKMVFQNPHVHILLTMRPWDFEKNRWAPKSCIEYLCAKDGLEKGFLASELETAEKEGWEKQYQYKKDRKKIWLPQSQADGLSQVTRFAKTTKGGRKNPVIEHWNSRESLLSWRQSWEDLCNSALTVNGVDAQVSCKSYEEQGIERMPELHLGPEATNMLRRAERLEREGGHADLPEKVLINIEIRRYNSIMSRLNAAMKRAAREIIDSTRQQLELIRSNIITSLYALHHTRNKLPDQTVNRYRLLSAYSEERTKIAQKISETEDELGTLQEELKAIPIVHLDNKKKLHQQIRSKEEQLSLLTDSVSKLPSKYTLDVTEDTAASELRELSYVGNLLVKEGQVKKKVDSLVLSFRKLFRRSPSEVQHEVQAGGSVRAHMDAETAESLSHTYAAEFSPELLSSITSATNHKLGISGEGTKKAERTVTRSLL